MTRESDVPLLDLIEAKARRDEGISQVSGNAGERWRANYRGAVSLFIRTRNVGDTFIGEDLRVFCHDRGWVGEPHHPNAWGAMARNTLKSWMADEVVARVGMASASAAKSHACLCPAYRVL